MGVVIEYRVKTGEWKSFRADLIPEVLDDAIKVNQTAFNASMNALTPEDVYDLIPRTYPKANPVSMAGFDQFPGLGRFDLENCQARTSRGWTLLAG